jgi:lipopolysaccharide/colanic/teichoic acid biosynthesis glycosyltransferase
VLQIRPSIAGGSTVTSKRFFDIAISLIALLVLAPIGVLIGILIKLDSPGPVLYQARRIGRGGRPFRMYKFRTMAAGADRSGPALTYKDDPRITRMGQLLRRVRIDEMPQLFNVLKGEMSLVGPRPEAPEYVDLGQPIWRQVLSIRPGICGLAQLTYAVDEPALLESATTLDHDYVNRILPTKLQLDLRYVRERSFLLDLRLILQTFLVLIRTGEQATSRSTLDRGVPAALPASASHDGRSASQWPAES